ncbi:hypothetical protein ADK67_16725 [Saccharothrix sp. NRRL B-16348]|uniref:hypothetical protein n=1 Tax=Saccharothrix sp. NRRL B-16348 TaxID=1415542 RepID=UPI0006AD8E41|nr:hypothetical protein [Saccharothrix sp. NRRL B-16348]KOX25515.1 hypothetical protein ADK67_16725 [Saccharothrix sp. NRRL B-16348]
MRLLRKLLGRTIAVGAVAASVIAFTALPASAAWHAATAGGDGATIRDCYHPVNLPPNLGCKPVITVPAWTQVRVVCQRQGQSITGYYGTSDLWNYVVWEGGPNRPEGYVADANLDTGYPYRIPGVGTCA